MIGMFQMIITLIAIALRVFDLIGTTDFILLVFLVMIYTLIEFMVWLRKEEKMHNKWKARKLKDAHETIPSCNVFYFVYSNVFFNEYI